MTLEDLLHNQQGIINEEKSETIKECYNGIQWLMTTFAKKYGLLDVAVEGKDYEWWRNKVCRYDILRRKMQKIYASLDKNASLHWIELLNLAVDEIHAGEHLLGCKKEEPLFELSTYGPYDFISALTLTGDIVLSKDGMVLECEADKRSYSSEIVKKRK